MPKKTQPLVSLTGGSRRGGRVPLGAVRGIDRALAIQRPLVLAHLRGIGRRNPHATTGDLLHSLERRYLATVTTSGAAVGVAALVPGIGTGTALALSGLETAGFLEATALFAQSVSEVHGLAVNDPDRARTLVLALMLGQEGSELVRNWAGQATGDGPTRDRYWGQLVMGSLPAFAVNPLLDRLKSQFLRRFAVSGAGGIIGKAIPFGIGAVVGGVGNRVLGHRVLEQSRLAFGTHASLVLPPGVAISTDTV